MTQTAVLIGRGRRRLWGFDVATSFETFYLPGLERMHRVRYCFYGKPFLEIEEDFRSGEGRLRFDHKTFKYDALDVSLLKSMWADMPLMPLAFGRRYRLIYREASEAAKDLAIDLEHRTREHRLFLAFDDTSRLSHLYGNRWDHELQKELSFRVRYDRYHEVEGYALPHRLRFYRGRSRRPVEVRRIDRVYYNEDVGHHFAPFHLKLDLYEKVRRYPLWFRTLIGRFYLHPNEL